MQLIETLRRVEYLNYLIKNRATGTPQYLASKLELSERQVYRLLDELREIGLPIKYSQIQESYYYEEEVQINISILIEGKNIFKIK